MTNSQLTQCPHCKASFKVSEEQLNAANGRVRCGACLNIFDAIAYQISSDKNHKQDKPSFEENESLLKDELLKDDFNFDLDSAVDLENELLEGSNLPAEDNEEDAVFADDPEEDKLEKGYSGSTKFDDELSSSFLELDQSDQDRFKTQFLDEESSESIEGNQVDESWAAGILDDLDEPNSDRLEPGFLSSEEQASAKSSTAETETAPEAEPEFKAFSQKDLNSLNFEYEQDENPKNKWLIKSVLVLLNLCLLLLLIAQASWFHYEKLVKYPKIAAIYELACQQLKCELPVLSDISKIENKNLVVRSHPTTFNALIIETTITNHASFEQAFPDISLSFSNINNQVIAQRLFKPTEYLNKKLLNWTGIPSGQPIQITLEIIDPGPEAVNYKIRFHPSHESGIDQ